MLLIPNAITFFFQSVRLDPLTYSHDIEIEQFSLGSHERPVSPVKNLKKSSDGNQSAAVPSLRPSRIIPLRIPSSGSIWTSGSLWISHLYMQPLLDILLCRLSTEVEDHCYPCFLFRAKDCLRHYRLHTSSCVCSNALGRMSWILELLVIEVDALDRAYYLQTCV